MFSVCIMFLHELFIACKRFIVNVFMTVLYPIYFEAITLTIICSDIFIFNMLFNVSDLDNPIMFVNDKVGESSNAVQISEGEKLRLSCYVNGNPVPIITLKKEASDSIILQSPSKDWWLNYTTSSKCSDTGTYKCTGESTKFNNTEKMFGIYVICKFSQLIECCKNELEACWYLCVFLYALS